MIFGERDKNIKYEIKSIKKINNFELNFSNLRSYYHNNILAFGDLLHKVHPLAGQGFNMTIRDIKILLDIVKSKLEVGLPLDKTVNIEFENKIAKKVNFWTGDKLNTVEANREIILSAGTIGSPHILQASGLGPAKLLKDNGIEVIIDHKSIGQNLIDHLMLRPVYKIKNLETLNDIYYSFTKKIFTGLKFFLTRTGPLTVGASYLCGFVKSDPHLETPNLQFHVSPASTDLLGKSSLHKFPAFTPTITNVRPTSRGSIEIKSSDTRIPPKIKMNYLSTDEDREIAGKSLKIVRKIVMESKAYKDYGPEELRPGINITDNEQLAVEAGKYANTIFHPVSTCRMGKDENAVVSDQLKVHGIKNLRVIDASVMPYITSGNTNAPTIMIAEKGADMILQQ